MQAVLVFLAFIPAAAMSDSNDTGGAAEKNRIVEIRSYNLEPGTRERFHRLFVEEALPLLNDWEIDVVAFGPSMHDDDSWFLMRSFRDLEHREAIEESFYGSAEWREGPRQEVLDRIDSYTTVVLPFDQDTVDRLRQTSLVLSLAGLTAGGFAAAIAVAQTTDSSVPADEAAAPEIEIREIRPGVWVHTSWYTYPGDVRFPANGLIVRAGDDLLLVDTAWGEQRTRELLDRIESAIGLPLRHAIVTHSHYDRVAGIDVLESRGVEVYAHPMTTKRTVGQGMPVPDKTLSGLDAPGTSVQLGSVEVFYPGPGHAPDNLIVWVPSQAVLFAGCAVRSAASGSLGSISDADLGEWPNAIRRAQARYGEAEVVVPGHGESGGMELLDHTLALLDDAGTGSP